MSDHGILFKGEMIRALLAGRKTQTRRVLPHQPQTVPEGRDRGTYWSVPAEKQIKVAVGDRLWVKETWRPLEGSGLWDLRLLYQADAAEAYLQDGDYDPGDWTWPKAAETGFVTPLFMPRWASRLTLIVTDVRVQRVQCITEEDAKAEGAPDEFRNRENPRDGEGSSFRIGFEYLWDRINGLPKPVYGTVDGKKSIVSWVAYPWDTAPRPDHFRDKPYAVHGNPWVVAYTFTVHRKNIDRLEAA